jgi:hypothetical protein
MSITRPLRSPRTLWVMAAAVCLGGARSGAETRWTGDATKVFNWDDSRFWDNGFPDAANDADISNGGTPRLRGGVTLTRLYLGKLPGQAGNLEFAGDGPPPANVTDAFVGYQGAGTVNQSSASGRTVRLNVTHLYLGYAPTGVGAYNYSDTFSQQNAPSLVPANTYVGYNGTGAFSHTGAYLGTTLYVGYNPGSSGTFTGSSGARLEGDQYVGYGGAGTMTSPGLNNARRLYLGYLATGNGTFHFDGGTLATVYTPGFGGQYPTDQFVGYAGTGTFVEAGGKNSVPSAANNEKPYLNLYVGYNAGASGQYTMTGGSLTARAVQVGRAGAGTFTQSGGTVSVAGSTYSGDPTSLYLGYQSGATGSYTLSGNATLTVDTTGVAAPAGLFVGYADNATGSFIQSGGAVTITSGALSVGRNNSTGTYRLDAGQLASPQTVVGGFTGSTGSGNGTFVQTGGTHTTAVLDVVLSADPAGSYQLAGGQLAADNVNVGTSPFLSTARRVRFSQTGGAATASARLTVGRFATYAISAGSLTATSPPGVSNSGSIEVSGGSATFSTVTGSTGTIAVSGSGTTLTATRLAQDALAVSGSATAILTGPAASPSTLNSLTLSDDGTLDVRGGALVLAHPTGTSPAPTLRAYLARAYNDGLWNHPGLTSSTAAADPLHLAALGYADSGTRVTVAYTLYGDTNLDGAVNAADRDALVAGLQLPPAGAVWSDGDFDYDGSITADDFALFALGAAYGSLPAPSTPEPALAVPLFGCIAVRRRRRGR